MSNNLGTLFIVATPIGNLSDMTFRALEILKSADVILCEDTRTTKHLLNHYEIAGKKLISYHRHSKISREKEIMNMIREGKNLVLVSDAGTPCISDPGVMLVAKLRDEFGDDLKISPIPGASALVSALSISGIPAHTFLWKGFIPHKKGRETFFKEISDSNVTNVFYESVHRILKTLDALAQKIPDRKIFVARELTKMFEESVSGTPAEILAHFEKNPEKTRGEFVIVVAPK